MLDIVYREIIREGDLCMHLADRLFPLRQKHIEVEYVFRSVSVSELKDLVPDRICMDPGSQSLLVHDFY